MAHNFSDQQLKDAVDAVFNAYDKDKSGTLDLNEVTPLINDVFTHLGHTRQVSQPEVQQFVQGVDTSGDKRIGKQELFQIFKKVMSQK